MNPSDDISSSSDKYENKVAFDNELPINKEPISENLKQTEQIPSTIKFRHFEGEPATNMKWFQRLDTYIGFASVLLSIVAILQTCTISKQNATINDFDKLLKNQQDQLSLQQSQVSQLQDLVKKNVEQIFIESHISEQTETELKILNDQLGISAHLQKAENLQLHYSEMTNVNRLYNALFTLLNIVLQSGSLEDSIAQRNFAQNARAILEGQFGNNFLLRNDNLNTSWLNGYDQASTFLNFHTENTEYYNGKGEKYYPDSTEKRKMMTRQYRMVYERVSQALTKGMSYIRKTNPNLSFSPK
jgi:hypothetical protein